MKRLYIIIAAMIISISGIMAQPGPVQKMAKSVFTLTTFNKDGQIIASTQGVFIDNKGTAIKYLQTIHRSHQGHYRGCQRTLYRRRRHPWCRRAL